MIKFYVHKNQLYHFLTLKEPITLISNIIDDSYFEVMYRPKDLIFTEYRTYTTVELKTFRKKVRNIWKRKNK